MITNYFRINSVRFSANNCNNNVADEITNRINSKQIGDQLDNYLPEEYIKHLEVSENATILLFY